MKKRGGYTDEELSRILGEHEAGRLRRRGAYGWGASRSITWDLEPYPVGCVNQAALNEDSAYKAAVSFLAGATWFDTRYTPDMSTDALCLYLAGVEGERTQPEE